MDSIILEIQKEAMDSDTDISTLLRKSWGVARKLKIKNFESWIRQELNGYEDELENIPEYREVSGDIQFLNPMHGWLPTIIDDEELMKQVSTHRIAQPITEIEYLLNSENNNLIFQLPQSVQNILSNLGGYRFYKISSDF